MSLLFPTEAENRAIESRRRREKRNSVIEAAIGWVQHICKDDPMLWGSVEFSEYGCWQQAYPEHRPFVGDAISDGQIHVILTYGDRNGRYSTIREDFRFLIRFDRNRLCEHLGRMVEQLKQHYEGE